MVNFVIKKDGKVEPYDEERIRKSIMIASTRTAAEDEDTPWITDQVLEELRKSFGNIDRVPVGELKHHIFKKINSFSPEIALTWRDYKK